jgi:hypothetical protein
MLKKIIKYTDYNGTEHSETLYFHVSKTSILTASDAVYDEIMGIAQDLKDRSKLLEGMEVDSINKENPFDPNNEIIAGSIRMVARLIDRLVDLSYGKRSEDGLKFIKSKEILNEFKSSIAYDAFIEQMISNQDEMIDFINKLVAN